MIYDEVDIEAIMRGEKPNVLDRMTASPSLDVCIKLTQEIPRYLLDVEEDEFIIHTISK